MSSSYCEDCKYLLVCSDIGVMLLDIAEDCGCDDYNDEENDDWEEMSYNHFDKYDRWDEEETEWEEYLKETDKKYKSWKYEEDIEDELDDEYGWDDDAEWDE